MAAQPHCKIFLHLFLVRLRQDPFSMARRGRSHQWHSAKPEGRLSRQTKETTLRRPESLVLRF